MGEDKIVMKDMSLRRLSDLSPKSHPPLHTIKMTNFEKNIHYLFLMTRSTTSFRDRKKDRNHADEL